jgi:hypothetical protein
VAISDRRILKLEDGRVTFRYRATETGQLKTCTLGVEEFMRRFLQHVLPRGFVKVRYYGFLASSCRPRLAALREQLGPLDAEQAADAEVSGAEPEVESDASDDGSVLCPTCGRPMRQRRRPPRGCPP